MRGDRPKVAWLCETRKTPTQGGRFSDGLLVALTSSVCQAGVVASLKRSIVV